MGPEDTAVLKSGAESLELSLATFRNWLEDGHTDRSLYQATLSLEKALRHVFKSSPELLSGAGRERIAEMIRKEEGSRKGRDHFNTGF